MKDEKKVIIPLEEYEEMQGKIKSYESGGVYVSEVFKRESWGYINFPELKYKMESANAALAELITIAAKQEKEIKQLREKLAIESKSFFQRLFD
jgi:hypothetical protein